MSVDLTLHQAADALAHVPPDERETWVRMAMALKSEYGPEAWATWDEWSRGSARYKAKDARAVWKSIKRFGRVSIASLIHEARLYGWLPPRGVVSDEDRARRERDAEARRARMREMEAREQADRDRRAAQAAMRAAELWRGAARDGLSPYLARKGVQGESVRYLPDGAIVVPMLRYDQPRETALVGAQTIRSDGVKRFAPGTAKAGSACRLGLVVVDEPILICEGLATGLSIRMATDRRWPVFVAFDAYNLGPVAEILRALYPGAYLLFCADDDFRTRGNPGRYQAWRAARRVGNADLTWPVFKARGGEKLTDYNDLHVAEGLGAVARHFGRVMGLAREYGRYAA